MKIETNPCSRVRRPPPSKARDRVLTDDELVAVWKASDLIDLARHLRGCTVGEAVALIDGAVRGRPSKPAHRYDAAPTPSGASSRACSPS
jgi:hypothetical protein